MARHLLIGAAVSGAMLAFSALGAHAEHFHATFSGFNEIGALNAESGAILSNGTATIDLDLRTQALTFKLTFANLGSNVTQAHIHFGKDHVAGGIFAFLCTNLGNGPAGTPACPPTGGTVTGTLTAASVLAIAGQNVPAGDFTVVRDVLESNTGYANIHTVQFPAGEIRGQIHED